MDNPYDFARGRRSSRLYRWRKRDSLHRLIERLGHVLETPVDVSRELEGRRLTLMDADFIAR
ncbi:MAG: hypothetical protein U9R15_16470 [Chloroflexota bacterium]|nr:hypothetical protein [Chloroflexota bacterium]